MRPVLAGKRFGVLVVHGVDREGEPVHDRVADECGTGGMVVREPVKDDVSVCDPVYCGVEGHVFAMAPWSYGASSLSPNSGRATISIQKRS